MYYGGIKIKTWNKKCLACDNEFPVTKKNQIKRFCSPKCSAIYNMERDRKGKTYEEIYGIERAKIEKQKRTNALKVKLICKTCGKEFYVLPHIARKKLFCSKKCFHKAQKGKPISKELHDKGIESLVEILEDAGYLCYPIGHQYFPNPDVIAIKNGNMYAFEVMHTNFEKTKYKNIKHCFDKVYWVKLQQGELYDIPPL